MVHSAGGPHHHHGHLSVTARPTSFRRCFRRCFRLVLDVREPYEFADGHVPAAMSIPQAELAVELARVPRNRDVLVACRTGGRSLSATRFLRALGYDRVTNLEEGTLGWSDGRNVAERLGRERAQPVEIGAP